MFYSIRSYSIGYMNIIVGVMLSLLYIGFNIFSIELVVLNQFYCYCDNVFNQTLDVKGRVCILGIELELRVVCNGSLCRGIL